LQRLRDGLRRSGLVDPLDTRLRRRLPAGGSSDGLADAWGGRVSARDGHRSADEGEQRHYDQPTAAYESIRHMHPLINRSVPALAAAYLPAASGCVRSRTQATGWPSRTQGRCSLAKRALEAVEIMPSSSGLRNTAT